MIQLDILVILVFCKDCMRWTNLITHRSDSWQLGKGMRCQWSRGGRQSLLTLYITLSCKMMDMFYKNSPSVLWG